MKGILNSNQQDEAQKEREKNMLCGKDVITMRRLPRRRFAAIPNYLMKAMSLINSSLQLYRLLIINSTVVSCCKL